MVVRNSCYSLSGSHRPPFDRSLIACDLIANTSEFASAADSATELGMSLMELPEITEAREAGFKLNTFAEAKCGFATGGN